MRHPIHSRRGGDDLLTSIVTTMPNDGSAVVTDDAADERHRVGGHRPTREVVFALFLDRPWLLGNNHSSVKRLALVLFVCLSVQMSALSAPFVHLHADAGHDTDHHGGRAVHRHVEAHDTAVHHHGGEFSADHSAGARRGPSLQADGEPAPQSLDGVTAAPATTITPLAKPATVFNAWSRGPLAPPPARLGSPVPAPPDISPSSLRGPPR